MALESLVLVFQAQILGPFSPPKKRVNFNMFHKHQKCLLCIFTPICCPSVFYSENKATSISSSIYFVYRAIAGSFGRQVSFEF